MKKNDTLIPAICPQCGAKIELGKNLQKGYCSFCGTEILIKDVVKNVNIVNSPTFDNYVKLADRAYENEDYETALEYYTSALKISPDDWWIVFRVGICKSMESDFEEFDIKSAFAAAIDAVELMNLKPNELVKQKIQMTSQLILVLNYFADLYKNEIKENQYNEIAKYKSSDFIERLKLIKEKAQTILKFFLTDEIIQICPITEAGEKTEIWKVSLIEIIINANYEICENYSISKEYREECVKEYDEYAKQFNSFCPENELKKIRREVPNYSILIKIIIALYILIPILIIVFFVYVIFNS